MIFKSQMARYFITFSILLLTFYFIYSACDQDKGFLAIVKLNKDIKNRKIYLNDLLTTKKELENNNKLIGESSVDQDMVEEQIRSMFGYVREGEEVIYPSNNKP